MTSQTVSRQFDELDPGVLVVCGDQGERSQICDLLEAEGFLARGVHSWRPSRDLEGVTVVSLEQAVAAPLASCRSKPPRFLHCRASRA